MSIISTLQTYLKTYSGLKNGAPTWVDFLGSGNTEYSIVPMPGARIVERYVEGGSVREFPFLFQAMESTADDAERLANNGFFEALSDWFETQTETGALPVLSTGKKATAIEAISWGYLSEQGESSTAIYAIQCKLTYDQQP
jgi:hypothetical protein